VSQLRIGNAAGTLTMIWERIISILDSF